MMILRNLVLLSLAILGVGMAVETVFSSGVKFEFTRGIVFFAAAIAVAVVVCLAIRAKRLPLRSWYALPLIIGTGFGILGNYNLKGWLSDISGATLGVAALIFSFAALQYWADKRGARDWSGIVVLCSLLILNLVAGAVMYFAK